MIRTCLEVSRESIFHWFYMTIDLFAFRTTKSLICSLETLHPIGGGPINNSNMTSKHALNRSVVFSRDFLP